MAEIKYLHIHYVTPKGKKMVKKIKPTELSKPAIQHDIATVVDSIRSKAEYYYVVAEISSGGKPAYRTIVPKIVF